MSTLTIDGARVHPAPTRTARPSLARLIRVELRKSYDTRSGMWLLIGIAVLTAAVEVILMFAASESDRTFENFFDAALLVQAVLIPVVGILLVTSEWSQRTGLVTFGLEPNRNRVIMAKVAAALTLALASLAFAFAVGAVVNVIGGNAHSWDVSFGDVGEYVILQALNVLAGLAFGMVLMNSAAAIVVFFVLPTVWSFLFHAWSALASVRSWVDFNSATSLLSDHQMTGTAWAEVAVATTIWVALPLAVGVHRLLRAELK
jgi:ABC-type transport system involved in multi-copper enzyme maturation permease subunit